MGWTQAIPPPSSTPRPVSASPPSGCDPGSSVGVRWLSLSKTMRSLPAAPDSARGAGSDGCLRRCRRCGLLPDAVAAKMIASRVMDRTTSTIPRASRLAPRASRLAPHNGVDHRHPFLPATRTGVSLPNVVVAVVTGDGAASVRSIRSGHVAPPWPGCAHPTPSPSVHAPSSAIRRCCSYSIQRPRVLPTTATFAAEDAAGRCAVPPAAHATRQTPPPSRAPRRPHPKIRLRDRIHQGIADKRGYAR